MRECSLTLTILTYNSEKYLNELLNSIVEQAAKDIQVIISDDCSTDQSVELVKNWKSIHEQLFFEIVFITSPSNTGVVENKKRTFKYIKGTWTKGIAGDDLLHPSAIKHIKNDIIEFINSSVIIGKAQVFGEGIDSPFSIPKAEITQRLNSVEKIKNYIFEGNTLPAISLLVKSEILTNEDFFKHAKKNFEDVPFHLELLTKNIQFSFSNNTYILYRKHFENLSLKKSDKVLSSFYIDYQRILLIYAVRNNRWIYSLNSLWNMCLGYLIIKLGNKGTLFRWLNQFRRKLQPKRFKNLFIKPY